MVWVVPDLSVKSADRGNCELKRLACSVNYDIKGGHSNRVKGKGMGVNCSLRYVRLSLQTLEGTYR
jgi:hypothetical protein